MSKRPTNSFFKRTAIVVLTSGMVMGVAFAGPATAADAPPPTAGVQAANINPSPQALKLAQQLAATPPTDPAVPPSEIAVEGGGAAGWVSDEWVAKHPNSKVGQMARINKIKTQDAFKCDLFKSRCIDVVGQGLKIQSWTTAAYGNVGCQWVEYVEGYNVWGRTASICPSQSGPGQYYSRRGPRTYGGRIVIFNNWQKSGETPTVTVG